MTAKTAPQPTAPLDVADMYYERFEQDNRASPTDLIVNYGSSLLVKGAASAPREHAAQNSELERAEKLYENYVAGVAALTATGLFDMPPVLKGFDYSIKIVDSIPGGLAGTHDYENGETTVRTGFKDRVLFHELTHSELGRFTYTGTTSVHAYNEGVTQILTRAIMNEGVVELMPPTEDEPYVKEQEVIAMLCDRSNGIVTFKDFIDVYTSDPSNALDRMLELSGKISKAYPTQKDLLVDSFSTWNNTYATVKKSAMKHTDNASANTLATIIATEIMHKEIDERTAIDA